MIRESLSGEKYILVNRKGACGSKCETCKHKCHDSSLRINIDYEKYKGEQEVSIEINESLTLSWIFYIYFVSVLVFFSGIYIGKILIDKSIMPHYEGIAVVCGIVFLVFYFVLLAKLNKGKKFLKLKG